MNVKVESTLGVGATDEQVLSRILEIEVQIADQAHVLRGRGAPSEAATQTLAGKMEQWSADLARAWELFSKRA